MSSAQRSRQAARRARLGGSADARTRLLLARPAARAEVGGAA